MTYELVQELNNLKFNLAKLKAKVILLEGQGRGNWGHQGRPGHVGGSGAGGGGLRNFTDEQIVQKVHDNRLLKEIYSEPLDFSGMTAEDRLAYFKIGYSTQPEFVLVDYGFTLKDRVPKNLTAQELRNYLKENNLTSADGKGRLSMRIDANKLTSGLSKEELDVFAEKYPSTFYETSKLLPNRSNSAVGILQGHNMDLSIEQKEKLSDGLDKIAGVKGFQQPKDIYNHSMDAQREALGFFSADKEVALHSVLSSWAIQGGGVGGQQVIREVSSNAFSVNKGIQFYEGEKLFNKADFSTERMTSHILDLKKETESFYKNKYAKKSDPDPDLSSKTIAIGRGIAGRAIAYTPSAAESWTTDKATVDRFGKMLGNKQGYTRLQTTVSYDNVLFTWESVKGKYGWPPESELKGKKEIVVLGGVIKEIQKEHMSK